MPRLIHCCYADKWPQQVGGVAAVCLVIQKLPITWLQNHIADAVKAALSVLKHLPAHAALERSKVLEALTGIMQLACPKVILILTSIVQLACPKVTLTLMSIKTVACCHMCSQSYQGATHTPSPHHNPIGLIAVYAARSSLCFPSHASPFSRLLCIVAMIVWLLFDTCHGHFIQSAFHMSSCLLGTCYLRLLQAFRVH